MENPLLDSDKALFFPKKPGYLSEKIENFEELQLPQNFCWNFIHVFLLTNAYEMVFEIFLNFA